MDFSLRYDTQKDITGQGFRAMVCAHTPGGTAWMGQGMRWKGTLPRRPKKHWARVTTALSFLVQRLEKVEA